MATVSASGEIKAIKTGETIIKATVNDEVIAECQIEIVNPLIEFTSGSIYSNNTAYVNSLSGLKSSLELLRDKIYTQQGYGALMLANQNSGFLCFDAYEDVDITFSSNSYSDGGGSSGKIANFYKWNTEISGYESYKSFTQLNNSKQYITVRFVKGSYKLVHSGNYVVFDEWDIVRAE